jgi:hypothetical protein
MCEGRDEFKHRAPPHKLDRGSIAIPPARRSSVAVVLPSERSPGPLFRLGAVREFEDTVYGREAFWFGLLETRKGNLKLNRVERHDPAFSLVVGQDASFRLIRSAQLLPCDGME